MAASFENSSAVPTPTPEPNGGLKHSESVLKRLDDQSKAQQVSGKESMADVLARLRAMKATSVTPEQKAIAQKTEVRKEVTVAVEQPEVIKEKPNKLQSTIARLENMFNETQAKGQVAPELPTLISQIKELERNFASGALNAEALGKLPIDYDGLKIDPKERPISFLRGIARLAHKAGVTEVGKSAVPTRELVAKIIFQNSASIKENGSGNLSPDEMFSLETYAAGLPRLEDKGNRFASK